MLRGLRILQLNVGKRMEVQQSLLNDLETAQFDVLVVLEPYLYRIEGSDKPRVTSHYQ